MMYPLIVLSIALFYFAWQVRFIPVSLANSASWLSLGAYLFIYMAPPLSIVQTSSQFLMACLFLMAFTPLLLQMRTDIQSERRARGLRSRGGLQGEEAETTTKHEYSWNKKPETANERQLAYKEKIRGLVGRRK